MALFSLHAGRSKSVPRKNKSLQEVFSEGSTCMIQTLTMLMKQYNFRIFKILQVAADHCQFLRDSKALKQGSPLTRSHACLGAALFCRLPSARWCLQCSCCAPAWLAEKRFLPSLARAVKGRLRCVCGPPAELEVSSGVSLQLFCSLMIHLE